MSAESLEEIQGPLFTRQALLRLIIPLVVEQLLAVTIGMADTVMVTSVGEAAVSGISLVDSINILLINIFSALATGGAVIAAQYLGRRDRRNACTAAKQLLYATFALALLIMVVSLLFRNWILRVIFGSIEADVMRNAQTYFWLSALSYPFLAIYNSGAALFRSMGNSKVSMFTSLLMNIVNISGNALLIFVFHWGVAGAATASLVSRALGAVLMLLLIRNHNNEIYIHHLLQFRLNLGMVKSILKIGVPGGIENSMFQIGKLLVQGLIATLGTSAIAANAIANNVSALANVPGSAVGLGLVTVVGQCVGARDYDQAMGYTKKLTGVTYVAMGALNILIFCFCGPLVHLFHLTPEAAAMAVQVLRYFAIASMVIWPLAFATPNALRAAGDAKFTMTVSMLSMWIFRIGFSYLLVNVVHMGLLGVWVAMFIDWIARSIVFTWRLISGRWKSIQVIE